MLGVVDGLGLLHQHDGDVVADGVPKSARRAPEAGLGLAILELSLAFRADEDREQLSDEVPYSVACEIEEFREASTPVYIRAVIHVERDSQKRILIGAKGARIRTIGKAARAKIEALVGEPIYLDLWVKVLPNWRRDPNALARLGYSLPSREDS